MNPDENRFRATLLELANEYPPELRAAERQDIDRIAFHMTLAFRSKRPEDISACDVGGGFDLFSVGCKAIGCKRSVLIDDFDDKVNQLHGGGGSRSPPSPRRRGRLA